MIQLDGPQRLTYKARHEHLQVDAWGRDGVRVRAAVTGPPGDPLGDDGALLGAPPSNARTEASDSGARLINGALTVELSDDGRLRFLRTADSEELLSEAPRHFLGPAARQFDSRGDALFRLEANFRAYDGERLYGLGQPQHGRLDQKGCVVDLIHRNSETSIPFLLSSRGYGLLWHNPAIGRVELGHNGTRWVAEATTQLDYWVTAADTPAEILERYADATGHAPMLPEWADGFWQCKLRYRSQDEILAVAREYRRRGLPLGVLVIDGGHWTLMGDWQFEPQQWPDPRAMVEELAEQGVKVVVSVWPTVNPRSPNFATMLEAGLLVRSERGPATVTPLFDVRPAGPLQLYLYDATKPEARAFLYERLREGYVRHGITGFWLDAGEPEIQPVHPDNVRYHSGPGLAVQNLYPMLHARGVSEGLQADGEIDVLTLNRAAWAGAQRYGAAVWSGDIDSTFEALRAQVRAGLSIGLSGIPWWTTDIGGFKGGDPEAPAFRELIVRWFQYGAFCPLFRLHGFRLGGVLPGAITDLAELADVGTDNDTGAFAFTGGPNEVWSFGDEAFGCIRDVLLLRERLRPYVMTQMRVAHERGTPPMRPLFIDFPGDEQAWTIEDAFLFGPDLLVAPVLAAGARERSVYLPAGANWTHAWTGVTNEGGTTVTVNAPIERIPVFTKDDARLPLLVGDDV